jgi:serralysin
VTGIIEEAWTGTRWVMEWALDGLRASAVAVWKAAHTRSTADDVDLIASDVLDLRGIDANAGVRGNQAFTGLIGASQVFSKPGQLQFAGGVLYGNTDRDSAAEFAIELAGVRKLGVGDLML